jgi:hypothetical protein
VCTGRTCPAIMHGFHVFLNPTFCGGVCRLRDGTPFTTGRSWRTRNRGLSIHSPSASGGSCRRHRSRRRTDDRRGAVEIRVATHHETPVREIQTPPGTDTRNPPGEIAESVVEDRVYRRSVTGVDTKALRSDEIPQFDRRTDTAHATDGYTTGDALVDSAGGFPSRSKTSWRAAHSSCRSRQSTSGSRISSETA